jgi:hypothetical protein
VSDAVKTVGSLENEEVGFGDVVSQEIHAATPRPCRRTKSRFAKLLMEDERQKKQDGK